MGWHRSVCTQNIDTVILGMHAHPDNPELARALDLGLNVVSYPEYLYHAARDKQRVVVGGSHGKTSITAMLLHVLRRLGRTPDFMVGAQLAGFDRMVSLTDAPDMLLEGDEYLSSPVDRTPKFHWYRPHPDHPDRASRAGPHQRVPGPADHLPGINSAEYLRRVRSRAELRRGLVLEDAELKRAVDAVAERPDIRWVPYGTPDFYMTDGTLEMHMEGRSTLQLVGTHNALNLAGALGIAEAWGVSPTDFLDAVQDFKGAAGRLERVLDDRGTARSSRISPAPSGS